MMNCEFFAQHCFENEWILVKHIFFRDVNTFLVHRNSKLAKGNHIEIISVSPEGLRPIKQFTTNGRVELMKFFVSTTL